MIMKKNAEGKAKPFLTGSPTDENTLRSVLKMFGFMVLCMVMTFLVCSMAGVGSTVIRIIINAAIETLILVIFYSRGADQGTDAVARGEILYQHVEKGQDVSGGERRIPYHKLKGFMIGMTGSALFLIISIFIALTAQRQLTGAGTLPSWMEGYMRRTEIGDALVQYTVTEGFTFGDALRLIVRIAVMPFVSMAGAENKEILLLIERISPLLVLLPGLAFGFGYTQGPARRKLIHTEIANNTKKRISRERRERKARVARTQKGPEQLN